MVHDGIGGEDGSPHSQKQLLSNHFIPTSYLGLPVNDRLNTSANGHLELHLRPKVQPTGPTCYTTPGANVACTT